MRAYFCVLGLIFICLSLIKCGKETSSSQQPKLSDSQNSTVNDINAQGSATMSSTTSQNNQNTTTHGGQAFPIESPVILGYFPSWSENWVSSGENSTFREIPPLVNHVFLAFARPNLRYAKGSYNIEDTGIQVPYDGCTLKESIAVLKEKKINVILSIGGETYWQDAAAYEINYSQIKDLVDDMGFAGIDWDFEPEGSFQEIGNQHNVNRFIAFLMNLEQ